MKVLLCASIFILQIFVRESFATTFLDENAISADQYEEEIFHSTRQLLHDAENPDEASESLSHNERSKLLNPFDEFEPHRSRTVSDRARRISSSTVASAKHLDGQVVDTYQASVRKSLTKTIDLRTFATDSLETRGSVVDGAMGDEGSILSIAFQSLDSGFVTPGGRRFDSSTRSGDSRDEREPSDRYRAGRRKNRAGVADRNNCPPELDVVACRCEYPGENLFDADVPFTGKLDKIDTASRLIGLDRGSPKGVTASEPSRFRTAPKRTAFDAPEKRTSFDAPIDNDLDVYANRENPKRLMFRSIDVPDDEPLHRSFGRSMFNFRRLGKVASLFLTGPAQTRTEFRDMSWFHSWCNCLRVRIAVLSA